MQLKNCYIGESQSKYKAYIQLLFRLFRDLKFTSVQFLAVRNFLRAHFKVIFTQITEENCLSQDGETQNGALKR